MTKIKKHKTEFNLEKEYITIKRLFSRFKALTGIRLPRELFDFG